MSLKMMFSIFEILSFLFSIYVLYLIYKPNKKTRKIAVLYSLLYKELCNKSNGFDGICYHIMRMLHKKIINEAEYDKLEKNFNLNKPSLFKHIDFYDSPHYTGQKSIYWWKLDADGLLERKKFIYYLCEHYTV